MPPVATAASAKAATAVPRSPSHVCPCHPLQQLPPPCRPTLRLALSCHPLRRLPRCRVVCRDGCRHRSCRVLCSEDHRGRGNCTHLATLSCRQRAQPPVSCRLWFRCRPSQRLRPAVCRCGRRRTYVRRDSDDLSRFWSLLLRSTMTPTATHSRPCLWATLPTAWVPPSRPASSTTSLYYVRPALCTDGLVYGPRSAPSTHVCDRPRPRTPTPPADLVLRLGLGLARSPVHAHSWSRLRPAPPSRPRLSQTNAEMHVSFRALDMVAQNIPERCIEQG